MNPWRTMFNVLAVVSGLLFVTIAVATAQNLKLGFFRHNIAWELAFRDGNVWLDNQPQLQLETRRVGLAAKQNDDREASAIQRMRREPWGSTEYQAAHNELNEIRDIEKTERSRMQAQQAASATRHVEHSASLAALLCLTAAGPSVWVIYRSVRWLRVPLPPQSRNEIARPSHFNPLALAAVVSALLCAASTVLWVRSFLVQDVFLQISRSRAQRSSTTTQLWSLRGDIQFTQFRSVYTSQTAFDLEDLDRASNSYTSSDDILWRKSGLKRFTRTVGRPAMAGSFWQKLGFRVVINPWIPSGPGTLASKITWSLIAVPLWLFVLLWAIAPVVWVRRRFRIIRNAGRSLCPSCGYDMRATPNRCPECGTVPKAKAVTA